ncbi:MULTISPECIES: DUF2513 domain-containing protein [Bacillati]|uniref:DUF2513 domain-containing protein n=1 Tax=Bacillati TaxID=1783272 RepID=UPI0002AD846F|nr:DUF2513 domain-containing protein [Staphylococcus warneri]AGC90932.1 hypothetical protein A284_08075 [Staphylococcus warneri SG1]COQ02872.1 Hypothetical protein (DUF2513) [Streptococcus pneumoniae]KEK47694.1 hypothetical protein AQ02_1808 [Staphylococcus warneri Lyso 1 2011]KEK53199.1 hypothetical protein AQ03_1779 [Staphylococcus warneri Lyso 2 2011]MCE5011278.1 DUF2513 domain-containing protein [Staphylococcus warneri]
MKLNHDCIRDLLLEIEEKKPFETMLVTYNFQDYEVYKNYNFKELMYCLSKLNEAGILDARVDIANNNINYYQIGNITFYGHEFLDNIRDDETWNEVKRVAKQTSSMSVTLLSRLAFQYLSKKFNLT